MVTLRELQAQVVSRYDHLGLPSWPDPHPGGASPREEEYSRVTEPARYRIVNARAEVWVDVLSDLPEVQVEALAPVPLDDEGHLMSWNRGVRLSVSRPGTLPLLLLEHDVWLPELGAYLQTLDISVAEPEAVMEGVPDCGCDACDSGSNSLLRAVDETISLVFGGPYVALRGEGWHAQWHPDGGGSGGTGRRRHDHAQVMGLCRQLAAGKDVQLPPGTQAFVGRPWLT